MARPPELYPWERLADPSSRQEAEDMMDHVIDFTIDFLILSFACMFDFLMWADWFLGYEDPIALLTAFSTVCFCMDLPPAAALSLAVRLPGGSWTPAASRGLRQLLGWQIFGFQKFTHMAPPPPPARRSWWFFGSPPPPLVPAAQTNPTIPEPPPTAAPPWAKTPKQQAAVALKRARQKDRKRRLMKGSNPSSPPCSPVSSPPSEPTPAERMPEIRVMPSLGAALGR